MRLFGFSLAGSLSPWSVFPLLGFPTAMAPPPGRHLGMYLAALKGEPVVVELHDDTIIRGVLSDTDGGIGLEISNALVKRGEGWGDGLVGPPGTAGSTPLARLYVRGSRVRAVHTSPKQTPAEAVRAAAERSRKARLEDAKARGRTVKAGPKGAEGA